MLCISPKSKPIARLTSTFPAIIWTRSSTNRLLFAIRVQKEKQICLTMTVLMKLVIVALVLISSAISSNGQLSSGFYESELDALQAIFKAWNPSTSNITTNLPGWTSGSNYNYSLPCYFETPWKGVLCLRYVEPNMTTTSNSNISSSIVVVGLTLDSASIVGTLPKEIANLQNLVILRLTGNPNLTGPIPPEIANLESLQILDLHGNNLTGNIPDLISLPNLQQLDLSGNQLTGQIPNVTGISCLETLKLSGNQLNSTNGHQGLEALECLTTLDLSNNKFSGPAPILTTNSLQYLNLSMNKFDGLPYLQTSNLTVLDLSQNNFNGTLPNMSLFSNSLQQLDLSDNLFDPQQVPTWLLQLSQLQTLALRGCGLFGSFPYTMASLPQLQSM
jgi:hypothetical protein